MRSRLSRRAAGGVIILAIGLASVKWVRGVQKPYSPDAPSYRQKGDPSAPIVIVEFSDFQCPACRAAIGVLKGLEGLYGDKLRVIFKNFPLRRHPRAPAAALAAECAGRQGKFWEMHDVLFSQQDEWSVDYSPKWAETVPDWPLKYARAARVDEAAWSACMKDPTAAAAVAKDAKEAGDQWVSSTPTFFINGKRFAGGMQLSRMGSLWIDKQLKK